MLCYSSEVHQTGTSGEYHNIHFCEEIRKIIRGYWLTLLSGAMVCAMSHEQNSTSGPEVIKLFHAQLN